MYGKTTARDIYDFVTYVSDRILNALTFLVPSVVNHDDERRLLVSGHVYILAHKMSGVNRETVSAFSSYEGWTGFSRLRPGYDPETKKRNQVGKG